MSPDSKSKNFSRDLRRNIIFLSRSSIRFLPYGFFRLFIPFFIALSKILFRKKRRIMQENLSFAFEDVKTKKEISAIIDGCLRNLGINMAELIYFLDKRDEIADRVEIEGRSNLDAALAKGNGAILFSAHFGNFPLLFWRMALAGYKTNYIMRQIRDEQLGNYVFEFSRSVGVGTIYSTPVRQCIQSSIAGLKDNQILFMLLDQNYTEETAVFVNFFGRQAATATGPVIFARKSAAPILPVFIFRSGPGQYKIIIDEPVELKEADNEESWILNNTYRLTSVIENYVRRYPCDWAGWMHRRWKSSPSL